MIQLARPLFFMLLVVSAALIITTTGQLPAQVVSHFGAGGAANGAMTRSGYLAFMLAFAVGLPLLMVMSMAVLPRFSPRSLSIPNRDYWLAPERREATLRYIGAQAYWLGSLMTVFIAAIHMLLIEANAIQPPRLDGAMFGTLLGAFLIALASWMVMLITHFRRRN